MKDQPSGKEKKISRTVYNYSSYTVSDVNKAKKVLTNRWTFCQYNKEQETCQNGNKYLSIAQLQSSLHNDFFNCSAFDFAEYPSITSIVPCSKKLKPAPVHIALLLFNTFFQEN